jgi:hypothetical protein
MGNEYTSLAAMALARLRPPSEGRPEPKADMGAPAAAGGQERERDATHEQRTLGLSSNRKKEKRKCFF